MNEVAIESSSLLTKLAERYPHVSIFASFTGFGASLLSAIHVLSIVFGFAGAIFGCVAGYYSMRCQYRKWKHGSLRD